MLPIQKLESLSARYAELEELLCQPHVLGDAKTYTNLSRERAELSELVRVFTRYASVQKQLAEDRVALADPDLRELAELEIPELEAELARLTSELNLLLLPTDANDARNTVLEIRAGTGGEEAALFAADLFRMYARYAEKRRWKIEVLSLSEASADGYKEIVALITGDRVYSQLRFEAGVHRVQRVPATEAQGRIHTSTATVAVLPEPDEVEVKIEAKDLRIDTMRAGGPGGQSVNTTDSAVRIVHLPTGLIVQCQDEKSQLKNRDKAMRVLKARLLEIEETKRKAEETAARRAQVGTGDRSERIRTYNFPQSRLTDHRIGLTLYRLDQVMDGDLGEVIDALVSHDQAERLKQGVPSAAGAGEGARHA